MKNSKSILFLIISVCALSFPASNLYSFIPDDKNSKKEIDSIDNNEKSRYTLSLGIGYQDDYLYDDFFQKYSSGFVWTAGIEGRIGEKGYWAFEIVFSKWYGRARTGHVDGNKPVFNGKITTGNTYSFVIKYYFINFDKFRSAFHFGFAPIPLISFDGGFDIEYNIYQDYLFIGLSGRVITCMILGCDFFTKDGHMPDSITLNLRYRI